MRREDASQRRNIEGVTGTGNTDYDTDIFLGPSGTGFDGRTAIVHVRDVDADGLDEIIWSQPNERTWTVDHYGEDSTTDKGLFCSRFDGQAIALKTHHGKYLQAHRDNNAYWLQQQVSIGAWEIFYVSCLADHRVTLWTYHNRVVQAHGSADHYYVNQQTTAGAWEMFTPVWNDKGKWSFLTHHNLYLSARNGTREFYVNQQAVNSAWEQFEVIQQ